VEPTNFSCKIFARRRGIRSRKGGRGGAELANKVNERAVSSVGGSSYFRHRAHHLNQGKDCGLDRAHGVKAEGVGGGPEIGKGV